MKIAFADTSFYIALVSPKDGCHDMAFRASTNFRGNVVTTEYVLLELGNHLAAVSRGGFLNLVLSLRSETRTEIVPSSANLFEQGLQLYAARQDKAWSLTDCISFVVMRERQISDALALDHHFEQAGFALLCVGK